MSISDKAKQLGQSTFAKLFRTDALDVDTVLAAELIVNGKKIDERHIHKITVVKQLDDYDRVEIELLDRPKDQSGSKIIHKYSEEIDPGMSIEIHLGQAKTPTEPVFHGKVQQVNPVMSMNRDDNRVAIIAYNNLFPLSQGLRTFNYGNSGEMCAPAITDKDIVETILNGSRGPGFPNYGLKAEFGKDSLASKVKYTVVHQYNKSDLDFLKERADLLGLELFVEDRTLFFRKRDTSKSNLPDFKKGSNDDVNMESFKPNIDASQQVTEVNVLVFDETRKPEKDGKPSKKTIVGIAKGEKSELGDELGSKVAGNTVAGSKLTVVAKPQGLCTAQSQEYADMLARSLLDKRQMSFITGKAVVKGHPGIGLGKVVVFDVENNKLDGKYYVAGCTHTWVGKGARRGYRVEIRFRRDAYAKPSGASPGWGNMIAGVQNGINQATTAVKGATTAVTDGVSGAIGGVTGAFGDAAGSIGGSAVGGMLGQATAGVGAGAIGGAVAGLIDGSGAGTGALAGAAGVAGTNVAGMAIGSNVLGDNVVGQSADHLMGNVASGGNVQDGLRESGGALASGVVGDTFGSSAASVASAGVTGGAQGLRSGAQTEVAGLAGNAVGGQFGSTAGGVAQNAVATGKPVEAVKQGANDVTTQARERATGAATEAADSAVQTASKAVDDGVAGLTGGKKPGGSSNA